MLGTHLRSYRAQTSDRARLQLYSLSFSFFLSLGRRLKNRERRRHRSSLPRRSFDPPARSFGLPDALRLKLNRGSLLPHAAAPATTNHRRHATSAPLPCHSRRARSRAPLVNKTHPRGRLGSRRSARWRNGSERARSVKRQNNRRAILELPDSYRDLWSARRFHILAS